MFADLLQPASVSPESAVGSPMRIQAGLYWPEHSRRLSREHPCFLCSFLLSQDPRVWPFRNLRLLIVRFLRQFPCRLWLLFVCGPDIRVQDMSLPQQAQNFHPFLSALLQQASVPFGLQPVLRKFFQTGYGCFLQFSFGPLPSAFFLHLKQ